jgi:hypothetical protein
MPIDYALLATEINTDPQGLGYAARRALGDDAGIAGLLNQVRSGIQVGSGVVPAYAVFRAIVRADFAALTAADRQLIQMILSMGQVDLTDPNTRAAFAGAFAGTATQTNLQALQSRPGSRAEQLFGAASTVAAADVARALGRG